MKATPAAGLRAAGETAEITRKLARHVVEARAPDVPREVWHEAQRAFLNFIGCALGGSRHDTVNRTVAALEGFLGSGRATLLGRRERLDPLHAALVNGISAHVLDFDDTRLGSTNIHPSAPVVPAILALAEYRNVDGAGFLHAYILGIEVACRVAGTVYAEGNPGWHTTGAAGVFGAAAAAGRLLGLTEQQMVWALGIAATQVVGLREMFGSMTKSFHPGRAAQNGLTAALLAAHGFTSGEQALEGLHGFARVMGVTHDLAPIAAGLGESFEVSYLSYKPFACGVVVHASIDGCLQLRREHDLRPGEIEQIALRVHPDVLSATGKKEPHTGLEAKFSVYHAVAAALVEGAGGEDQFSERCVERPEVAELRARVTASADSAVRKDEAWIAVKTRDGRLLEEHVEHALGSVARPMSDRDLEEKFEGLAQRVLPAEQIDRLIRMCWNVCFLDNVAEIARAAVPKPAAGKRAGK